MAIKSNVRDSNSIYRKSDKVSYHRTFIEDFVKGNEYMKVY